MPLTSEIIDAAVARYWREIDRYEKLAEFIGITCRSLIEEHGIRGQVQWRAKNPDRLRAKLSKYLSNGEHASEFTNLDGVFVVLKDLAGARITTYVDTDRARVIRLIQARFEGYGASRSVSPVVKDTPDGLYRATHCMVRLKEGDLTGQNRNLIGLGCEVQVCSQLAHVYNEFEHDIRYKPLSGKLSKNENDLLNALARLMEVGDTIINQTRDAVEARHNQRGYGASVSTAAGVFPESQSRNDIATNAIASSPTLLTLAGLVRAADPQKTLPETLAALYREMIRQIASGALRIDVSNTVEPLDADALLGLLVKLAWYFFISDVDVSAIERRGFITALASLEACTPAEAERHLAKLIEIGFIERTGGSEWLHFCHDSFRDYLAACHIVSAISRYGWHCAELSQVPGHESSSKFGIHELLDARAFDRSWEAVITFVAELTTEPLELFQMLAERDKDDQYRHRLSLLCRCYRNLGSARRAEIAPAMKPVFREVLRIAKRCEKDDPGHRKPWLEWAEALLSSSEGADYLVDGLLALSGRYHGWGVSLKVLELLDRVLVKGHTPAAVIESIARFSEKDEHQWGVNTARLALRLAENDQREALEQRFADALAHPSISSRLKVRFAEAVSVSGDSIRASHAAEILVPLALDEALDFETRDRAIISLISLLDTPFAPVAAPILIDNLLNPASKHHFWLAWRLISYSDKRPNGAWSSAFLAITLFSDRESDQRLKLWSAQVLSGHPRQDMRDLGFRTLWELTRCKNAHSWVHAARWLVERGPSELADRARALLFAEASDPASNRQREATAELFEMNAIDPLGGDIKAEVHDAVRLELQEHNAKYGPRLNISAPGAPEENVDLELFNDNPAVVIKLLHTFNGPSPYRRDGGDPNDDERRMKHWTARLLFGTRYWHQVLRASLVAVDGGTDPDRDGALGIVLFGATSGELVDLLRRTMSAGRSAGRTRHYLLEELDERGWRFRFRGHQVKICHRGREEPLLPAEPV